MELAKPRGDFSSRGDLSIWAGRASLLATAYVITGLLGLQLAQYQAGVTLVWAPTGLSLAALILFGRRLWPGVFIGALLVGLGNPSTNFPVTLGIAVGNTLGVVVGATLLIRVADFRPSLERARDGIAFLLIGVLGCTTISATIGSIAHYIAGLTDADSFGPTWLIWWLGDLGSVLILTPLLLMLVHGAPSWRSLARRVETWLALACLLATSSFAFFGPELGVLGFAASVSAVPVLVWVGTRLGPRGATTASFIMILIAIGATASGVGPFVLGTPAEAMFLLWSWAMLIGITAFTLAAVVEQRNLADRRYRLEEAGRLRTEKQKLLLLERERLTREMHDGLGGQLVSVLAMVERGLAAPSEVAESIRRAIDDIRIVIESLDPATTDLPASFGKLRARLDPLLRRNGIALSWHVDDHLRPDALAPEGVLHVLRIIQEAVTNTLRHADASTVEVAITLDDDENKSLRIEIRDDGHGLPVNAAIGHRGINNMRSRAKELGTKLRIANTDSGTQVDLTLPLPN
jgi:signal transduction histidine kinase